MRKYRIRKRNFYILLIVLFVLSVGIGYSALTQRLNIDNTVSYDAMKWDVGFINVSPVQWSVNSVLPVVSVSDDKKTVYIDCDFGSSTSSTECVATAAIANDSTFNVELNVDPVISYDSELIKNVEINWVYSYENPIGDLKDVEDKIVSGVVLGNNDARDIVIRIISNDLSVDMLPSEETTIPISITLDWVESNNEVNEYASNYVVGNEITIGNEKFNVISSTPTTVSLLSQKSLGDNYRQSDDASFVNFSNTNGWEYAPGPKDVDIQKFDGPVKTYLNEYGTYLKSVTGDTELISDLITVNQLVELGCFVQTNDYSPTDGDSCMDSIYADWLVTDKWWWTKSAWSTEYGYVTENNKGVTIWTVSPYDENMPEYSGSLFNNINYWYDNSVDLWGEECAMGHVETCENYETWNEGHYSKTMQSVRPVITISKDKLLQYLH